MPHATLNKPTNKKLERLRGVDSMKPLLTIKADDSGNAPVQIELLSTGMWDAPFHGVFMITPQDLQQYCDNFNADVRASSSTQGLPIDYEHDADGGAAGWIMGLSVGPASDPTLAASGITSLWASVEWTPNGAQAIIDGEYKFISPEFCPEGYMDPEGVLDDLDNVLIGAGLTNRPLLKGLQPVTAHDGTQKTFDNSKSMNDNTGKLFIKIKKANAGDNPQMELAEITKKETATLSEDEKKFLADHKSELSADEVAKFGLDEAPANPDNANENNENTNTETNEPVNQPAATTTPEPAAPVAASEGSVTISASELASLKASAEKGAVAHAQLERKTASEHIDAQLFNDSGVKLKPELRDEAVSHYLSLNDKQREAFDKLMEGVQPIVDRLQFNDTGTGADPAQTGNSATAQIRVKANEMVKEQGITYAEAVVKVATENPDLAKAYESELVPTDTRQREVRR